MKSAMSITDYFPYEPTTGQWMAVKMLETFFENPDQVFILQGYAGTGKTSLLKAVLDYLDTTDGSTRLLPVLQTALHCQNIQIYIRWILY